jgi:regulatory protein
MKITAIKPQIKKTERLSIFVDGVYSFSLSQDELLRQKLTPNQELSKQELSRLKQLSSDDKIYINVLRFVSMRPRSEGEVKSYLVRKKLNASRAQQILNKLTNLNLVNDKSFAGSWVDSRQLIKPRSSRQLQQELRRKNIPKEIIETTLADKQIDEIANITKIINNKRRQPRYRDDQKIIQYLARQGFNYGDIKAALKNLDSGRDGG